MYNTKYILFFFIISFVFSSCRKYVEIEPKGKVVPSEVRDYRLLLNNSGTLLNAIGMNEYGTDDISFLADVKQKAAVGGIANNLYAWNTMIYNQDENDGEWNNLYKQIYVANVVINGIPKAKPSNGVNADQVLGEALVLRAANYLYLINSYAKVYNPATADTDDGVPLILLPDLEASLVRADVQTVYSQILTDLNAAVTLLTNPLGNRFFASKASAYAFLARTYLMMSDFEKANQNATASLALINTLQDYNTLVTNTNGNLVVIPDNIVLNKDNIEIIQWRQAANGYGGFFLSDEVIGLYQTGDIRKTLNTLPATIIAGMGGTMYNGEYNYNTATLRGKSVTRNVGPTVAEMMLIQAEYQARSNNNPEAMKILNGLRVKRFTPSTYVAITSSPNMLKTVLDERRRELLMRGARWFDLRRFTKEPALAKVLVHQYADGGRFELQPGSPKYVLPIPPNVIASSNEIKPNER
ncbi:RagB/SusD family nutrient uptake outer membrane protein [Pedobacter sp.]|uniref:RagB/SusD family nutrient uptake outer membrane protein n=1 Tax=Pedobacter sp. TaxID=1411316 RepID=UPI003BAA7E62